MKLKSLLLGSAAALALAGGAQAADPIVSVVSLDACDAFGISGLTISTDGACLLISGEVNYDFTWGDYTGGPALINRSRDGNWSPVWGEDGINDWESRLRWELNFEATSETDFGNAVAVLTLEGDDRHRASAGVYNAANGADRNPRVTNAYVSVGDTTVLTAGLRENSGSLANLADDTAFTHLGQFLPDGVQWTNGVRRAGHVIQLESDFGNGISAGIGLERLNAGAGNPDHARPGTLVGVVEVSQSWGTAHFTALVNDVLNGFDSSEWAIHTGATARFGDFRVRGALAANNNHGGAPLAPLTNDIYLNGLLSAEATFDMFTIAGFVEATNQEEVGFGASVSADVTETVEINVGFRYFTEGDLVVGPAAVRDVWQIEGEVVAAISDNLEASFALGTYISNSLPNQDAVFYGIAGLEYTPSNSVTIEGDIGVNSLGAYRLTFGAEKSF